MRLAAAPARVPALLDPNSPVPVGILPQLGMAASHQPWQLPVLYLCGHRAAGQPRRPPPGENSFPGRRMGRHGGTEPAGQAEPILRARWWSLGIRKGTPRGRSGKLWALPEPTLRLLCGYTQTNFAFVVSG